VTIFRVIVFFLLVAGLLCLAMYVGTKQQKWRYLGIRLIKWTVIAALGFFAVLLLERLAIIL
jgi:disulfide bond formation protein DsbB